MSTLKKLEKQHGGQWLYVRLTPKGKAVWRNASGLTAIRTNTGLIAVVRHQ